MASATLTYGKKRGLLRSLGSRRRKHLMESITANKDESPIASTSDVGEAPRRTTAKRSSRDLNIDQIASRLLDDSNSSFFAVHQTHARDVSSDSPAPSGEGSPRTPEKMFNFLASPAILSPLMENTMPSPSARPGASRVGKSSPRSSGKKLRQHSATRPRTDPSQQRKESGLLRPLPKSKTLLVDPLNFHPTTYIAASSSVPLSAVDVNVGKPHLECHKTPARTEFADAHEINQKVNAMLAATQALKAVPQQAPNSSTTKFTRKVSSRVLAKVSSAWDRLHSKPLQGAKGLEDADAMEVDAKLTKPDPQSQGMVSAPVVLSPISTIEIRLNEGGNLNKKKVQKIVGGQVVRKPVADDGRSLRSGRAVEDPFAESGGSRTPTPFENRLLKADLETNVLPPLPQNPFDSEKGFDNNIEDRILCTTPVGSSTPRIRMERSSMANSDQSPTKRSQRAKTQVDVMLDHVVLKLEKGQQMRRLRQNTISPGLTADAFSPKRVKKHPSPSKEALEDLEMAFRNYTHLQVSGAKQDELDELASSFLSTSRSLAPRDPNKLMTNRLSLSITDELSSVRSQQSDSQQLFSATTVHLSRIPRPVQVPLRLRKEIRLAPPYRPSTAEADEVDELQWTNQSIPV